jgi:hypothetical protein
MATLTASPQEAWNAFVNLCFQSSYEDLSETQRIPHLAFLYDGRVQNGGHLLFFDCESNERVAQTIEGLRELDGRFFADVLARAFALHLSDGGRTDNWSTATGDLIDLLDREFYGIEPTLQTLLERYLAAHRCDFIEIFG